MTPRDLDLTSNLSKNTYENTDGNRFRGLMPTSSTPFTNPSHHHQGLTPDQSSEISSPLNKRHLPNGLLQSNLQFIKYPHQISPVQTSASASPHLEPQRAMSLNQVSGRPFSSQSDPVVGGSHHDLPSETPARVTSKLPSAADRLAAAVMEGAPESHWTFLVEPPPPQVDENPTAAMTPRTGIRRSKVVEELLLPMRPSLSSPTGHIPHDHIIDSSRSAKDSDLPQSLIDEARRTCRARSPSFIPSAASDPNGCQSRLSKSARYSSAPNLIRPTPQRPPTFSPTNHAQDANLTNPSSASEQVQVLDARVNQLLSHIRSDQLEKANLVAALAEARSEVAALRDEVRLLRVGVQKLGENQPYRSADGRLERIPATLNTQGQDPPKSLVEERGIDTSPSVPKCDGSSHHSQRSSQSFEALPPQSPHPDPARKMPNGANESYSSPRQPNDHPQTPGSILTNDDLDGYLNKLKQLPAMAKPALNQEAFSGQPNGRHQSMGKKLTDERRNTESSIQDLSKRFLGDLALGLTFTRCVDYLIMNPTSFVSASSSYPPDPNHTRHPHRSHRRDHSGGAAHPPRFRSDPEIFDPVNLDRLFSRLKVWKLLILRSSSTLSSSTHPDPRSTRDPLD